MQKKQEKGQFAITTLVPLNLSFAEKKDGGYELMLLKPGKWDHPVYGMVEITPEIQEEFVNNFNKNLRAHSATVGLPIDEEHYTDRGATGWIKRLINKGNEGLFGMVEWNIKGRELIKNAIYRFFSPEFYFKYEDPEDQRLYNNVLVGGALTNRPYFKGLNPVVLSEKLIYKHMDLKEISKKVFADLTDDEKSFVTSHFNELDEDVKEKFEELEPTETEEEKTAREEKEAAEKEEADKKAADEAKAKEEADTTAKAEAEAEAEATATVQASEGKITMSEVEAKKLREDSIALKKMQMSEKINGFIYSENNADGKLPATLKDKVTEFAMSLSEDQATKFYDIIGGMPSAKLFAELGESALANNDGSTAPKGVDEESFNLDKKAKELMKANDKLDYQEALIMAEKELAN